MLTDNFLIGVVEAPTRVLEVHITNKRQVQYKIFVPSTYNLIL